MMSLRELMRDKRVAGALAGLAVLFVAYRIYMAAAGKPAPAPAPAVPEAAPAPAGAIAGAQGSAAAPSPHAEAAGASRAESGGAVAWSWGRNPFVPTWKETRAGAGAAIRSAAAGGEGMAGPDPLSGLRGTVVSGNTGIAVFGSRLVAVGGRIGEWTVERVDPYAVTLRSGNDIRVVELFKPPPTGGRGRGGER